MFHVWSVSSPTTSIFLFAIRDYTISYLYSLLFQLFPVFCKSWHRILKLMEIKPNSGINELNSIKNTIFYWVIVYFSRFLVIFCIGFSRVVFSALGGNCAAINNTEIWLFLQSRQVITRKNNISPQLEVYLGPCQISMIGFLCENS